MKKSNLVIDTSYTYPAKRMSIINGGEVFIHPSNGEITVSGVCVKPVIAGPGYSFRQNRPNPFNPTTEIEYTIPIDCYLALKVFDALGRDVATLDEGYRVKGTYLVTFNAGNIPSGIYF